MVNLLVPKQVNSALIHDSMYNPQYHSMHCTALNQSGSQYIPLYRSEEMRRIGNRHYPDFSLGLGI